MALLYLTITTDVGVSQHPAPIRHVVYKDQIDQFRRLTHDFKHGHLTYSDYKQQMDQLKSGVHPEVVTFLYDYIAS